MRLCIDDLPADQVFTQEDQDRLNRAFIKKARFGLAYGMSAQQLKTHFEEFITMAAKKNVEVKTVARVRIMDGGNAVFIGKIPLLT